MADTPNGWIGTARQLYAALQSLGCDRDADDKFCVDGNITTFLGIGDEFVVGDQAVYYVNGEARPLAPALQATGTGRAVTVL